MGVISYVAGVGTVICSIRSAYFNFGKSWNRSLMAVRQAALMLELSAADIERFFFKNAEGLFGK